MYTFCEWQGMTSLSSFWRADSFGCPEDSIFIFLKLLSIWKQMIEWLSSHWFPLSPFDTIQWESAISMNQEDEHRNQFVIGNNHGRQNICTLNSGHRGSDGRCQFRSIRYYCGARLHLFLDGAVVVVMCCLVRIMFSTVVAGNMFVVSLSRFWRDIKSYNATVLPLIFRILWWLGLSLSNAFTDPDVDNPLASPYRIWQGVPRSISLRYAE